MRDRLLPLAAPLIVVIAVWAAILALSGSTAAADRQIADTRDRIAILFEEIAEAERLDEGDGIASDEVIAAAEVAVPGSAEIAPLLVTIHRIAADGRIAVEQIIPTIGGAGSEPTEAGASTITLTMSGSGTYERVMAFLEALESSDRLVLVTQVQLAAIGESDELLFDIVLEVYTTATLTNEDQFDEEFDGELDGVEADG